MKLHEALKIINVIDLGKLPINYILERIGERDYKITFTLFLGDTLSEFSVSYDEPFSQIYETVVADLEEAVETIETIETKEEILKETTFKDKFGFHDMTRSEYKVVRAFLDKNPEWPSPFERPAIPVTPGIPIMPRMITDEEIIRDLSLASLKHNNDLKAFTNSELILRFRGYFEEMYEQLP